MQFVHEFLRFLGDASAQNDEIGPQQRMIFIDDYIQFARPGVPAQIPFDLCPPGGAFLGFASADLQMAELGVRNQAAIDKECAADTGTQREQQHRAGHTARGAVAQFREPRGVCIIDRDNRALKMPAGQFRQRLTDPGLVEIRRGAHDPAADNAGKRQADGVIAGNIRDDRGECAEQRFSGILRRCRRAESFARESPGVQID